jgi:ABC-2 type transport system permease protein
VRVILAFAVAQTKSYWREPIALGWTVAFPLLLLLILGAADGRPVPGAPAPARDSLFLLMGIIGMNVVSIGLFGVGLVLVQLRAIGFFRRLAMTPQPPWVFVAGQILATALVVLATTAVLVAAGGLVFGVPLPARPLQWSVFLALGTGVFLAIGFALAATVRETRTAQMFGNLAFLALVSLGGVWYPIEVLPEPVRWVSAVLPLPHLLAALREAAAHGREPSGLGEAAAVLTVWWLVASVLACSRFRWHAAR